jgi:circadian clock protein KaiC
VLYLRFFEAFGAVHSAISVPKHRSARQEDTIREFLLDGRLRIGRPLKEFQGILSGIPQYLGKQAPPTPDERSR